ncbi:MAG: hypothetical protein K9H64_02475 [Bacteroidales bacterium]|nr:hypothetical protein [Bacteroidales bacterium]MCF8454896.1 hypothetical protein [Bacteroidales bacterium]
MENEKNNISKLKNRLPQHIAPESVWESVEEQFQLEEQSTGNLKQAIAGLPVYLPPEKAWEAIDLSLNKKRGLVFSAHLIIRIAAVLILALAIGFLIRDKIADEKSNKLALVEKPTQFNLNDRLEMPPSNVDIKSEKPEASKNQAVTKNKQISQKKEMLNERDAIEKIELVTISSININKLEDYKKKDQTQLSENLLKSEPKVERKTKINRVKLIVHNDPPPPVVDKRRFTFALFRPVSYSQPTKDTLNRNTKPLFAASINL